MGRIFKYAPEFPELKISHTREHNIPQQQINSFSTVSPSDSASTLIQETINIADPKIYDIPVNL